MTTRNIHIAQALMGIVALSAVVAGVGSISNVTTATNSTIVVETWRMIGFFTFAMLFGVLAIRPRISRLLWAIVILNKLALTGVGLIYVCRTGIKDASDLLIFDGTITLMLVISSLLAGVWKNNQ